MAPKRSQNAFWDTGSEGFVQAPSLQFFNTKVPLSRFGTRTLPERILGHLVRGFWSSPYSRIVDGSFQGHLRKWPSATFLFNYTSLLGPVFGVGYCFLDRCLQGSLRKWPSATFFFNYTSLLGPVFGVGYCFVDGCLQGSLRNVGACVRGWIVFCRWVSAG